MNQHDPGEQIALSRNHAEALVGVLAVLQSAVLAEQTDADTCARLHARLVRDGVLAEVAGAETTPDVVQEGLDRLNQQLRAALGEYD